MGAAATYIYTKILPRRAPRSRYILYPASRFYFSSRSSLKAFFELSTRERTRLNRVEIKNELKQVSFVLLRAARACLRVHAKKGERGKKLSEKNIASPSTSKLLFRRGDNSFSSLKNRIGQIDE